MSGWNVFSNHGHVLLFLAREPGARLRDVAANVGITERAVQKIVRDMQDSGVVEVFKVGRRNRYSINAQAPLRHALEAHCTVGQVVGLIASAPQTPRSRPSDERELRTQADPAPMPAAASRASGVEPPAGSQSDTPAQPADVAKTQVDPSDDSPETPARDKPKPVEKQRPSGAKKKQEKSSAEQGSLF